VTSQHPYIFQQGIACGDWRESDQAHRWVGHLVAEILGLSVETNKPRIKAILKTWRNNGVYVVERRRENGREAPFVIVGRPVDPSEIATNPHLKTCGEGGAESVVDDPR
jgi:hypothetical protein